MHSNILLTIACFSTSVYAYENFKSEPLDVTHSDSVGFSQIEADSIGLNFSGAQSRTTFDRTLFVENGGVASGDVNGDGRPDLFFCGLNAPSKLFLNTGDWRFEDATSVSGIDLGDVYINAAIFSDIDADNDLDLLVGSLFGDDALFLNDGKGRFSRSNRIDWEMSKSGGITSMAMADVDGDGDLDLYTTRYLNNSIRDRLSEKEISSWTQKEVALLQSGKSLSDEFTQHFELRIENENGISAVATDEVALPDCLYINDGTGHFASASKKLSRFFDKNGQQIDLPADWGLTASFRDVDGDGDPDLYVCNDFSSPDRFWINDGLGHFSPAPDLALRRTSNSSMGIDFSDINLDGAVDFFVVDMLSRSHSLRKKQMGEMTATKTSIGEINNRPQIMQNTLFLNRNDVTWAEIAQFAGLKASEWSWSPQFVDIDLDGYDDLIITTGATRDYMDADVIKKLTGNGPLSPKEFRERQSKFPPLPMSNFIFRNNGDLTFENLSSDWGFEQEAVSGGMALADFDLDGDLDVVINNTDSDPEVYRNNTSANRISVRLNSRSKNTQAIGARITLTHPSLTQSVEITSGGSYASHSDFPCIFATPHAEGSYTIEVLWPNGEKSTVLNASPNHSYRIHQVDAKLTDSIPANAPKPIFTDASHLITHRHHESEFDDFIRQPLLPNRLSQLGPGVSWMDIDNDGRDELAIPSGRGGKLSILANLGNDEFRLMESIDAPVDQTSILSRPNGEGGTVFILGLSSHESDNVPSALPFSFSATSGWELQSPLIPTNSSTGPLAQSDIDGDGDLDLFVGGRAVPGQYPRPASSLTYRFENNRFEIDHSNEDVFKNVGLVSGAAFGDIDQDGDSDLVIACEWGPVRIFKNSEGIFTDTTIELGIAEDTGWWNGVGLGDFNNDGLLDIIATNWGRNSKYEGSYDSEKPLSIYFGDIDANGTKDIIEAHFDEQMQCLVPERGFSCSARAMPFIGERMKTFENFGLASLEGIFGNLLDQTEKLEARTLEHSLFLNRGGHFERIALPVETQLSTAFGVSIGDLDGDGNEDIFLSENFFAMQIETPRNDAGRGLVLVGDGNGKFTSLSAAASGIRIYGEQRGSALSDFNHDGRADLAVAQNGADTKLYQNTGSKVGLRVKLIGPIENIEGIGSTIRLQFGNTWGPARLITSGSGYWSQNSTTQVMGIPSWPTAIKVTWPNGHVSTHPIPRSKMGSNQLNISSTGKLSFN